VLTHRRSFILQEHVTAVVKHYGERAYCWDVVNEAIEDGGGPARARSHCRFVLPLIHFIPVLLTYLVHLFLERQYDRTPGPARGNSTGLKPSAPWYPAVPDYIDVAFKAAAAARGPGSKVRKTPSWPRNWANFSRLLLYSDRNA
jgi:hypothetical protein